MKRLIEDYKRQLKNLETFLEGTKNMNDSIIIHRTREKAECYRTLISELEAIEREANND